MLMCLYTVDCTKREHSYFHCGQLMYQTILKKKQQQQNVRTYF